MKKYFKILLWIIIAAVFAATFYFIYKNSQPDEVTYKIVTPLTDEKIERKTILTGKIEPRDEIEIKPQISGIISEILIEPGDMVTDGQVIARIKVIPDASQLSSAQNRVEVARIALDDARAKFERERTLFEKKLVSREEFETAEATFHRAEAEMAAANDAYDIVREGISRYNASESNTNVRATITGQVLDVPVKVGSSVIQSNTFNDGTTVATIADMTNLIFRGKVDETEVGNLKVGMPMEISIGALPDAGQLAHIEYIAPKGVEENAANTFEVKAAIETDSLQGLRSGYSANASVALVSNVIALAVPESVVEFVGDSAFVYLLTDSVPVQKFERKAIETGISDGINIEVKSGIDSSVKLRGDRIVK